MVDAVAVEARSVSKVFGTGADAVRALDGVSVTIRANEFFTLLGPSGCGKTTLLRLIAGFELPTAGEILLEGQHDDYLRIGEMIAAAGKPTLFVMEGGYAVDALGINTVNVLTGFEQALRG